MRIPLVQLAEVSLGDIQTAVLGGGLQSLPPPDSGVKGPEFLQAWAVKVCARVADAPDSKSRVYKNSGVQMSHVLLTGATGYVGAFMLGRLLRDYPKVHVYCVARGKGKASAAERVQQALAYYRLLEEPGVDTSSTAAPGPKAMARVEVLAGDLSQPQLGLSAADWERLGQHVDTVYHSGAIVNAVHPLSFIAGANVNGTLTLVNFCLQCGAALHHISTLSLLPEDKRERPLVPAPAATATAYAKSKWLAEQVVWRGVDLGLRARVYRLGTMAADSATGACNPNDSFIRIASGLAHLGASCDARDTPVPTVYYLAPIDWAVGAVIKASVLPHGGDKGEMAGHIGAREPTTLRQVRLNLVICTFTLTMISIILITRHHPTHHPTPLGPRGLECNRSGAHHALGVRVP